MCAIAVYVRKSTSDMSNFRKIAVLDKFKGIAIKIPHAFQSVDSICFETFYCSKLNTSFV